MRKNFVFSKHLTPDSQANLPLSFMERGGEHSDNGVRCYFSA